MKKEEIQKGVIIHNGKEGRFYEEREVLDLGPQYVLYPGQMESDNARYLIVTGSRNRIKKEGNITRARLAAWGKGIVDKRPFVTCTKSIVISGATYDRDQEYAAVSESDHNVLVRSNEGIPFQFDKDASSRRFFDHFFLRTSE
ncbi:hypothetical protein EHV15_34450 [Paenibacillus oralis]|uniref:Uncharacterized protein n=1 Tax=Paenibacillus oralis TaxID=2490856 RepID=A0A3P3T9J3_9BACL|nr:hypothetical protein [Paenibacillus oralis]RRJ54701.1 hypothetical protein EHV15_34450 [Paenibacillus oralis]